MSVQYCAKCKKVHKDYNWQTREGQHGWYCSKWFTSSTVPKGIETRSMRPDGTIATGLEGIRLRDSRLRAQEKNRVLDNV